MDLGSELAMHIRNIAAEVCTNTAANKVAVLEGRIDAYDQANGTVDIVLAQYYTPGNPPYKVTVPYGLFMAGNGYGDYFYPEPGQSCVILAFADAGDGGWVQVALTHDTLNPPANFTGSGIAGPLQPGDRAIYAKGDWLIRAGSGKIQLGSTGAGGTTPTAVEGSYVTHAHTLTTFLALLAAEIATYISANPSTAAMCGLTDVAAVFAALVAAQTDIAGNPLAGGLTPSATDVGQGAQSVLLPAPGQS